MNVRVVVIAVILASLLSPPAKTRASNATDLKFAVEISGRDGFPPNYVPLTPHGVSSLFYGASLRRTAASDPSARQPTALRLEYRIENDKVIIASSVFYGEFDTSTTPTSLANLPHESAGTYSATLNETISLTGLEKFGLEPIALRIVPARPSASFRPATMSKVPTVQIEIADADRTFYTVVVKNTSTKAVAAFGADMPGQNGRDGHTVDGGPKDLIPPGGTYRFQFGIPRGGKTVNGSFIEDPPPPMMVLEAAVFADGSYEGDPLSAAEMTATRLAAAFQRQRVNELVEGILADSQSDDDAKIARIRAGLVRLPSDPPPVMMEKLSSEFPGLTAQARVNLQVRLKSALSQEKQKLESGLQNFERNRTAGRALPLAKWWSIVRAQ